MSCRASQLTFVGIIIAMVVLLPETGSALRAAMANRLQTSINLAYGSALASIGLTITIAPRVAVQVRRTIFLPAGTCNDLAPRSACRLTL